MATGYLIVAISIAFSIVGIMKLQWMVILEGHNIPGMIVFILSILLAITGYISRYANLEMKWRTRCVLRLSLLHKVNISLTNEFYRLLDGFSSSLAK